MLHRLSYAAVGAAVALSLLAGDHLPPIHPVTQLIAEEQLNDPPPPRPVVEGPAIAVADDQIGLKDPKDPIVAPPPTPEAAALGIEVENMFEHQG